MHNNEYLLQRVASERLHEARARAAIYSMLRQAQQREVSRDARPGRFALWWQIAVARAAHLALPKSAIRL